MKPRIYQLEVTNYCNAKCSYCPHSSMTRPKGYINEETVNLVAKHCNSINQQYVALHHMGEPLLHMRLPKIIKILNDYNIKSEFSTNGLLLKDFGPAVLNSGPSLIRIACDYFYNKPGYVASLNEFLGFASRHYPDTTIRIHTIIGNNLDVFYKSGNILLENKPLDNWAGQIKNDSKLPKSNCYFLDYNYVVVLWDGSVVPCCLDYNGTQIIGNVKDLSSLTNKEFSLCKTCQGLQFAQGGAWTL